MRRPTPELIELMARAGYERSRRGRSLPPWEQTHEPWREGARQEMEAALDAGLAAKLIEVTS